MSEIAEIIENRRLYWVAELLRCERHLSDALNRIPLPASEEACLSYRAITSETERKFSEPLWYALHRLNEALSEEPYTERATIILERNSWKLHDLREKYRKAVHDGTPFCVG